MKNAHKVFSSQRENRDSMILCRTSQGYEVRATPLRITRHVAAFEVYNPYSIVQLSEVLKEFRIVVNEQLIYSGRATVSNLVNAGSMLVCEANLDDGWLDVDLFALVTQPKKLRDDFLAFFKEWQRVHVILPEYKTAVADMQNYFMDLKRWLEQVELGVRSSPLRDRAQAEGTVLEELVPIILPTIDAFLENFEGVAQRVPDDLLPSHRSYAKRLLHPHLLCSPFAFRTYQKPLGYAGDYEMINMILRNPLEGSSLFSKLINAWILNQRPAEAHRNRIQYLTGLLCEETARVTQLGRPAKIFNVGCGPAAEVQKFLARDGTRDGATFMLLDFNEETLDHTRTVLDNLISRFRRDIKIELLKKSVHQVLKEEGKPGPCRQRYDFVYCAGVFDYLSDRICKRLMNIFYQTLEPGGLLVATNVSDVNPSRNGMEYLLDWHLIYRNAARLKALLPDQAPPEALFLRNDQTGVNLYLEIRKPHAA